MSIKLIALDLDGTLLNSDKLITKRTEDVLKEVMSKGIYVTIATGRMFLSAEYFGRKLGLNAPIICCNGTQVQGIGEKTPVFTKTFSKELMEKLFTFCDKRGWYFDWFIGTEIYAKYFWKERFEAYRTVENFRINEVGEDFLSYTENVVQCVIHDAEGQASRMVDEVLAKFGDELDAQQSVQYCSDITPKGVTKALGIEKLAEHLGIRRDEIMFCGDAENDLAALKFAKIAVVPANGIEEAKALATFHAPSNDEDGIAHAIEELILKGYAV